MRFGASWLKATVSLDHGSAALSWNVECEWLEVGRKGAGIPQLLPRVRELYESASQRIPTGELNRFLETLTEQREPRILYITQPHVRPPTFVLFTDRPVPLHFSKERFLINQLRRRFGFLGTPIVLKTKPRKRPRPH